jgi:hypothetical protein
MCHVVSIKALIQIPFLEICSHMLGQRAQLMGNPLHSEKFDDVLGHVASGPLEVLGRFKQCALKLRE